MCIIFHNPNGTEYNLDEIRNAFDTNNDGVGLMFATEGEVVVVRELMSKAEAVELAESLTGIPHALHFRFATHGGVNTDLCHPFKVSHEGAEQEVWMMHNGVIADGKLHRKPSGKESDTSVFAEEMERYSKDFGTDIFFNESFIEEMSTRIGGSNKVIFLRGDGKTSVLNPASWTEDTVSGIWYSNTYSIQPTNWYGFNETDEDRVESAWKTYLESSYGKANVSQQKKTTTPTTATKTTKALEPASAWSVDDGWDDSWDQPRSVVYNANEWISKYGTLNDDEIEEDEDFLQLVLEGAENPDPEANVTVLYQPPEAPTAQCVWSGDDEMEALEYLDRLKEHGDEGVSEGHYWLAFNANDEEE